MATLLGISCWVLLSNFVLKSSGLAVPVQPFIVGGVQAKPNELPYQVSLQAYGNHICGGSIYNSEFILTAAHCVDTKRVSSLTVVAGEHSLASNDKTEQTRYIKAITIHPDYKPEFNLANDIAVLELSSPLSLNNFVAPIKLPNPHHEAKGVATVSGWGATIFGGELSTVLRKVNIPIITDTKCKEFYGSALVDSMICAGFEEGGKDSCQGDSGGPMAVGFGSSRYLAGIVSWGNGCAFPENPGVYTEVSHFIDFIQITAPFRD